MNKSLRHLLFFTKSQKIGLIILTAVLFLLIVCIALIDNFGRNNTTSLDNGEFASEVEKFSAQLKTNKDEDKSFSPVDIDNSRHEITKNSNSLTPFRFDPNTLDSAGFAKLGIKPFVIKNILKYRQVATKFYSKEDFKKIYGLKNSDYQKLEPYIEISAKKEVPKSYNTKDKSYEDGKNGDLYAENLSIELNSADTAELKKLKGIGKYWASAIVFYRNKLGGYHSVNQLLEIKNFPSETFDKIRKSLYVDGAKIRKIKIKWATVEQLKKHPYLNFYQSKAIFEYRNKTDEPITAEQIRELPEFENYDFSKVEPYLQFDSN